MRKVLMKLFNLWMGIKWLSHGAPSKYYCGYHCGCCGKWHDEPFVIPNWQASDSWWDRWGVCPEGKGCNTEEELPKEV